MSWKVSSFAVLVLVLGTCLLSEAQIFRVQGGASTLFGANGASVNVQAPGYEGDIGAGMLDGRFQYGFLVRTNFLGYTLSVGDDTLRVELPTDVFDSSHYFLGRGVGLERVDPKTKSKLYGFVGSTSLGFSTPFFMAAQSEAGLGLLYYERPVGNGVRFVSRNLFSDRKTAIQALEWSALRGVRLSASAGVGSNQPYAATAAAIDRENLVFRAAYIAEGEKFQRIQVPSPISTEAEKLNVAGMYRVNRRLSLRGSHENILQAASQNEPILRATVDEADSTLNIGKTGFGTGIIKSRADGRSNLGLNLYANRTINRLISVNGNFYQSRPSQGGVSNTATLTVREQVNQKLSVSQTMIRSNGQTTASLGGEFVGNRLNAFVGYQTVYVPFRPDNAFQQALSFNLRINLPNNMQLSAGSFVDPQGKVRYTVSLGTYLYRVRGMIGSTAPQSFRFPKFVIEGIVVDIHDQPIEGAAIHVDGKVAYSDSDGRVMIRIDKAGPHVVQVAMEEFMAAGVWEVVEAPSSTIARSEDEATPIRIVLRRVPVSKPNSAK
jgi:hypothetical protein